jgi:hypothetical protein
MNTGGKNYDESKGVVAHNAVHHSKAYPSQVSLSVVSKPSQKKLQARAVSQMVQ